MEITELNYHKLEERFPLPEHTVMGLCLYLIEYRKPLPPLDHFYRPKWDGVPYVYLDRLTQIAVDFTVTLIRNPKPIPKGWAELDSMRSGRWISDGTVIYSTANQPLPPIYGRSQVVDAIEALGKIRVNPFDEFYRQLGLASRYFRNKPMIEQEPSQEFKRFQDKTRYFQGMDPVSREPLHIMMTPEFFESVNRLKDGMVKVKTSLDNLSKFGMLGGDAGSKYQAMIFEIMKATYEK